MRLRFRKPSLPVLILLGIIIGIIFYILDNPAPAGQPLTEATIAVTAMTTISNQQATPAVVPTATHSLSNNSNRPSIPPDTSIFIPTAGIWSDVIQAYLSSGNWDISNLRSNAGHLEGTAWVNQPGNVVISGHVELSSGLPGIFAELDNIQVGDVVRIRSEEVEYTYVVTEIYLTMPDDLQPLMPTPTDRLTLITCDSYDLISNSYRERLIVIAERVSS
ncbi:MAG: sortase [Anaerolineae bacterium]